jgi:serine phosphatase RsbU (regulator of sigma subunit)/putative methionine-R-sulfoxide reductase with GAF domain
MQDKLIQFRDDFFDLYSEINLHSLLQKIAEKVKSYLDCEESSIFIYNPQKEELYFEIVTGNRQDELKQIVMKKGEGVVGWIAEQVSSVIINDCSIDDRFTSSTDAGTDFKTTSIVGAPVEKEGRLLGVIEAINKKQGAFSENDLEVLEYIANFISIPLQNALLFRKVTQESGEKARLIELGQAISHSYDLEEIFDVLKNVIVEVVNPLEIGVMVESQGVMYNLIKDEVVGKSEKVEKTRVHNRVAVFPLRTQNKTLGFLQVELKKSIPDDLASLIKGIAVFAAISIEKFELFKQIIEKEKMEKEIQIAREIQQSFLLNKEMSVKGMDVAYINIPSSQVGGDYYDIISLNDHEIIVTINDISGHGIPASLLMSIFRANFVYGIRRNRDILTTINHLNNLISETTDTNLYVTSFTGMVDLKKRRMRWINSGHIPTFILRKDEVIQLKDGGPVLGMFADISIQETEIGLKKDDFIVMYTDGITEAEDAAGNQFALPRLIEFVKKQRHLEIGRVKDNLIEELKRHVGADEFDDDVTFILLRIT